MEQFWQLGEALGSLKALMVFKDNIQINQRQCCLLLDVFTFTYDSIAEEIRQNLKFEEKHDKWKFLQQPLKEIHRIFKEGEAYVKRCLEIKDWWAIAIISYQSKDCVELYIHNLLSCIPIIVEAIESAEETSGWNQDKMQWRKIINSNKYRKEYVDMNLFQWKFGKRYLVSRDFCNRYDTVWMEDRWFIINKIQEKMMSGLTKQGKKLADLLLKNLKGSESMKGKLLPSSILLESKDYQVRRRLRNSGRYKEITWLGESFVVRQLSGDVQALEPEITSLLSLSHTNIMEFLCGFVDNGKKECLLLMELMSRNLSTYIKEVYSPRKRIQFTLPVAVDLMLQIARGMEYLHSKKIYHGELNPLKIIVKPRGSSSEGYMHAKISGFGLSSVKNLNNKAVSNQNGTLPLVWYPPEVHEELEQTGSAENSMYTEKSDVYSFGMVCFELLTGKVPFDDNHPKQRPSFSSICRILRYIKRFLVMNPDCNNQLDSLVPLVDYYDVELALLKKFPSWGSSYSSPISQIPFQIFAFRDEPFPSTTERKSFAGQFQVSI